MRLKTFKHGIHPAMHKDDTRALPIKRFPFAPVLTVPLLQHTGLAAKAVVREGQEVVRGQLIGEPDGFLSTAMHAPVSGTVERLDDVPTVAGKNVPGVTIRAWPGSTQEVLEGNPVRTDASAQEILHAIQWAGIVGLGGAAFPTHAKLTVPEGKFIDTVIVNGAECEPCLTTDHRVMLEQAADIMLGLRYVLKATGAARVIIALEANKIDCVTALQRALPTDMPVGIEVCRVKYPQGAEKMLVKTLLGREVPSGGLPVDVHAVVINAATTAEIGRLLPHGRGIQERVITIAGDAVRRPGNYRIPIGTPLRFALEHVGLSTLECTVFLGGPMMGASVSNLDVPITKGTSGFMAMRTAAHRHTIIYPCIHCGRCLDACPMYLNPARLGLLAKTENFLEMVQSFHLMDCFECGACSYVCPSHIPLVHYFRLAKAAVRKGIKRPA